MLANPGPAAWTADTITPDDLDDLASPPKPTGLDANKVEFHSKSMTISLADDFPSDSAFLPIPFDITQRQRRHVRLRRQRPDGGRAVAARDLDRVDLHRRLRQARPDDAPAQ